LDVADRGGATLDEVGAVLGVTRERARQIVAKAVQKLRRRELKIALGGDGPRDGEAPWGGAPTGVPTPTPVPTAAVKPTADVPRAVVAEPAPATDPGPAGPPPSVELSLAEVERRHLVEVMSLCGHRVGVAARLLGLSRSTMCARAAEFGLRSAGRFARRREAEPPPEGVEGLAEVARRHAMDVLARSEFNVSLAAFRLGVSRSTMYANAAAYGVPVRRGARGRRPRGGVVDPAAPPPSPRTDTMPTGRASRRRRRGGAGGGGGTTDVFAEVEWSVSLALRRLASDVRAASGAGRRGGASGP